MAGNRNFNAPPPGRRGLPDTTGCSQPSMSPVRKAAGSARGATNQGPVKGMGQKGPTPKPSHRADKPGV